MILRLILHVTLAMTFICVGAYADEKPSCELTNTPLKQFNLSASSAYTLKDSYTDNSMGYQLGFNYLYQVSGFCSGPASHIGFFTDYLKISPLELSALNYGLYIKHMLSALPNIFLSYGLGTTQSFFEDYPSRTIGHLTKLEAGWYVPDSKFYLGLLYEFHILPLATEKEKSLSFNSVHFNLGYQLK